MQAGAAATAPAVPDALAALAAAGNCVLAPSLTDLKPYEENAAVPAADMPILQRCYVGLASPGEPRRNQPLQVPFRTACSLPLQGTAGGTSPVQLTAELRIAQAPAAFALPALTRRKFHTPFKATLAVTCDAPLRFAAGVKAYSIDEADVAALATWSPAAAPGELSGGEHVREVLLQAAADGAQPASAPSGAAGRHRYRATCEYAFPALAFTSPSSVRPRWLLFAAPLPGGALLLTHFLLPTIVMSRAADQSERAARLLWGDALPARGFSTWTLRSFTKWVRRELQLAPELSRELEQSDIQALALRAGLALNGGNAASPPAVEGAAVVGSRGSASDAAPGAAGAVGKEAAAAAQAAFQNYVAKLKALLHVVRHQYDRDHPRIVCGLAKGRHEAENALHGRPSGTFLVRFASEGDALVLSCVVARPQGPPAVEHVRMGLEQLSHVPLDESLALSPRAQALLDLASGRTYPLEALMQRAYMHDDPVVELARKRKLAAVLAPAAASGRSEHRDRNGGDTPRTPSDAALLAALDATSGQSGPALSLPPLLPAPLPVLLPTLAAAEAHAEAPPPPLLPMLLGGAVPQPDLFPGWCAVPGHAHSPAPSASSGGGGVSFSLPPVAALSLAGGDGSVHGGYVAADALGGLAAPGAAGFGLNVAPAVAPLRWSGHLGALGLDPLPQQPPGPANSF